MKIKYILKKAVNLKTGYLIAIVLLLILVIGGYFSYAIFTASSEAKGALNIVTGNLYSLIESADLDENKSITIPPEETKIVTIKLTNANGTKAKVNLYYQATSDALEIGYLADGDEAPNKLGYVLEKNGENNSTKTIYVKITNNDASENKITFGTSAGLENATLDFPTDKKSLELIEGIVTNSNIVAAYTYDQDNEETKCITGEEETCQKTRCYENKDENNCPVGTIVKYKINDSEIRYFYVLHDDGDKMTLQQRENTTYNSAWNTLNTNTSGPLTILENLEETTKDWTNVNDITYTMGTIDFNKTNAFTGCYSDSCTENVYVLPEKTAKARMITKQELLSLNSAQNTYPIWVYNYMYNVTSHGGTIVDNKTKGYWTMSATISYTDHAYFVNYTGATGDTGVGATYYGARAVIEINKGIK